MSDTQEFFDSLRSAFARDPRPVWLMVLLGVVLLVPIAATLARWRARVTLRRGLHEASVRLAEERRLSDAQVVFVEGLAERAAVSPLDLMQHLAVFERATARELLRHVRDPDLDHEGVAKKIAGLRAALGFHILPPDHWLLSTRELQTGDQVKLGTAVLTVTAVSEAHFALALETATKPVGAGTTAMEVIRPHDARYIIHCKVLGTAQVDGQWQMRLGHDEHPERLQQRAYVRVRVDRPISWVELEKGRKKPGPALEGHIVDVSAGGISFDSPHSEPQGSLHECSFELAEGAKFKDVGIIVIDVTPAREQADFRIRAAFSGLSNAERDRLAAAVAWHERQEAARLAVT
jgi:hypothetical protein